MSDGTSTAVGRKRVLVQFGTGSHARMLAITDRRHRDYANKHGMKFVSSNQAVLQDPIPPAWNKLAIILNEFALGASVVVWMDADAVIVNHHADISKACRHGIGMARYDRPFPHYQSGVMIVHNEPEVVDLISGILSAVSTHSMCHTFSHEGRKGTWEQHPLNIVGTELGLISSISQRWNWVPGFAESSRSPNVLAYHGFPIDQRISALSQAVSAGV